MLRKFTQAYLESFKHDRLTVRVRLNHFETLVTKGVCSRTFCVACEGSNPPSRELLDSLDDAGSLHPGRSNHCENFGHVKWLEAKIYPPATGFLNKFESTAQLLGAEGSRGSFQVGDPRLCTSVRMDHLMNQQLSEQMISIILCEPRFICTVLYSLAFQTTNDRAAWPKLRIQGAFLDASARKQPLQPEPP